MYSLWEANERRKPVITCEYDLIPEFAGEKLILNEEDIIRIVQKSLGEDVLFQEAIFIPRVNVILTPITSLNLPTIMEVINSEAPNTDITKPAYSFPIMEGIFP